MRLNQLAFLLGSTVIVGAVVGLMTSATGLWVDIPWYAGLVSGAFFATTSLMGFWAYLTLNFVARITLPRRVWRWAQALLIVLVVYDMLWGFHGGFHAVALASVVSVLWPLVIAGIGAYLKQRMSGRASFLPALFFLYVFTMLDSLPFIWLENGTADSASLVNEIVIGVMVCNLYILLIYGKLLSPQNRGLTPVPEQANKPSA